MNVTPPSADEASALLALHAHRFPQRARLAVLDDGGARLTLPFLLGIPSGAARMPGDARASPVWRDVVAGIQRGRLRAIDVGELLAQDCVLWPDTRTFAAWRARWPKLSEDIMQAVLGMIGALPLEEPGATEEQPGIVEECIKANPRAVWRRMRPSGACFDVVIDCPDAARFDGFMEAVAAADADQWRISREFAEAQVLSCSVGDKPQIVTEVFARYPGLPPFVAAEARNLGGAQGDVFFGSW